MNYIVFIILLLIFIILIINCYAFLILKWHNDYSISIENACNDLNQYHLEYETYRHNIYRFLYNIDNNNFTNSINLYTNTYYIIILLITIILISYIKNIINLKTEHLMMLFIFILFYIIYIYIGNIIISNYEKLKNILHDDTNDIYKYAKIYKILNAIMYINNFKDNVLGYTDINIRSRKFDDVITNNIASYINSANTAKIVDVKMKAYNKLDFIKYITLDQSSPYYFKYYFNNIYINKK